MKKWRLANLILALAGLLISISGSVFCGEDNPPENPDPVTKPLDDKSPFSKPEPAPELAPRPATFADYIPLTPDFSTTLKPVYPVVENKVSSVANQLVRDSANEGLFLAGAGPQAATLTSASIGDAVPLLHTGAFKFRTQLTIDNYFNDNYLGSGTNRRGSWLRNETPSFAMGYDNPDSNISAGAFYSFTFHDYTTNVARDYYDETGGATVKLKHLGIDGLSFSISDLYNQIGNTILNPLANQYDINNLEFRVGTRYATNSLPVTFAFKTGPLSLEASYTYDTTDYFSRDFDTSDSQVHTGALRGSYDITPGHCTVFGEASFAYTRFPSFKSADFDFGNVFVGLRGTFDKLTYQVRTGYSVLDDLGTGTTISRPLLAADVKYVLSRTLDFAVFGNRSLSSGVLTGQQKVDAYGAVLNLHPMLRGHLGLGYIFQATERLTGTDQIRTAELSYRHKIKGWLEPSLGMKYSLESVQDNPTDEIWTALAGIGFKVTPRARADLNYYHEIRLSPNDRKRITDRLTAGYTHVLNSFASATFGFDHAARRDNRVKANVRIEELRLGVKLSW